MTIVDFIRLVLKHIVLLLLIPILLASLVILLTMNPDFEYSSQTVLYTGLATGTSIEMDKRFDYQATNADFDNLINMIVSRETQEEVAIRLLAQHLMLKEANPKYISKPIFDDLKNKIPAEIYGYVAKGTGETITDYETNSNNKLFPPEIDRGIYEKTVQNLIALMNSSHDNYIYEVLNYDDDEHYSLNAISKLTASRIANSDLVKLSYTCNDPGICQQTLAIYNEVCTRNYKNIKENSSDAVVKYFESQLQKASEKLRIAEDSLLYFNIDYNIINYYEQSKAVAVVKEDMEVDFKKKSAELAGTQAEINRLEEKLQIQDAIQNKSNNVIENKKLLGEINYKIALLQAEIDSNKSQQAINKITELKKQAADLAAAIKRVVNELYSYENTIDGLPVKQALPIWMNNVAEAENLKAKIKVIDNQNKDFQKVYAQYAPAGANMKRIEREISVSEQGYIEILHGLNLAKLKLQDSELSSKLKTIDAPFYPLSPNPTKRGILVIAAAFLGGILTLGVLLVMEYFDDTLKNVIRAKQKLGLPGLGMLPKIIQDAGTINLQFVQKRLIEIIKQNIEYYFSSHPNNSTAKTIVVFSTQRIEGKTVVSGNLAKAFMQEGKKVLLLNHSEEQDAVKQNTRIPFINKLLGYHDSRIDFENTFLEEPQNYLDQSQYFKYQINNHFFNSKDYVDILKHNNIPLNFSPEVVIIELPAIIYHNYPAELIAAADLNILVCRANRVWTNADQSAIKNIRELSGTKLNFIVNGVHINELESVLGELPKRRSRLRKKMKEMFKFQFYSKNQI